MSCAICGRRGNLIKFYAPNGRLLYFCTSCYMNLDTFIEEYVRASILDEYSRKMSEKKVQARPRVSQ
ncbi:MAG: hypothetical protein DRN15_07130 [Thermoprotei archaeon]|nr:MAG: hypothetical protein DRN15_07130 [Thermoprotei archaeon]